jgi:hypothetical protein
VDFLRGKAKKEYMQNSEVKVYNMYENRVLPYEEFKELPIEKQVVLMTKWREEIGTNNIIRDMKVSRKKFYNEILKNLGIETKPRGRRSKSTGVNTKKDDIVTDGADTEAAVELLPVNDIKQPSFSLAIGGLFDGHNAANRLARLSRMLEPEARYELKIEIRELNYQSFIGK